MYDADPCALPEEFGLGDDVAQGDTRRRTGAAVEKM